MLPSRVGLSGNVRLSSKGLPAINTLAYLSKVLLTTKKKFYDVGTWHQYHKTSFNCQAKRPNKLEDLFWASLSVSLVFVGEAPLMV